MEVHQLTEAQTIVAEYQREENGQSLTTAIRRQLRREAGGFWLLPEAHDHVTFSQSR